MHLRKPEEASLQPALDEAIVSKELLNTSLPGEQQGAEVPFSRGSV